VKVMKRLICAALLLWSFSVPVVASSSVLIDELPAAAVETLPLTLPLPSPSPLPLPLPRPMSVCPACA